MPVGFNDPRPPWWDRGGRSRVAPSENLSRKLFLSSRDAILLLSSTADEFLDVNPKASVAFGHTREQFLQVPPKRAICVNEGQWDLLLDSLSTNREKWLQGMACRQRSGRIFLRDILPCLVDIHETPFVLATVRDARCRELSNALRTNARFTRFSNGVAVGAAQAPTIERAIRFCLQQVCDYDQWVFAHAHIFSEQVVAHAPADIWHFGLHERAESLRAIFAARDFVFPEEWYSRILAKARTSVVDLETELELAARLESPNIYLKSVLLVPILDGNEIIGVCQYFSDERMNRDQIFLGTMSHLAGRLGHIIKQKHADEDVRNLSTKLIHAEDDERRNLARELHDTTAQHITAILMDLGVIERTKALPQKARQALSECISLTRRSLHEIRTLSYLLHPPMLDELGFVSALRIFIEGFSQRSGVQVRLDVPDPCPKVPRDLEITLFRVVQEGLTNARRHSDSVTADVSVRFDSGELRLSVENESTGELLSSETRVHPAKLGVGMRSMQERVQRLGGHLTFDVGKNRTVLQASFPFAETAHATSA